VLEIRDKVDLEFEVSAIVKEFENKYAILFRKVKNDIDLISGIYGDRKRLAVTLGLSEQDFLKRYLTAIDNPSPTKVINNAPVHEVKYFGDEVDLSILPIPKIYEHDAGPYLTASIVIAKDPLTGVPNASYHRMLPISRNKLAVRVVKRDLWHYLRNAEKKNGKLEAAVVLGVDPAVALAASTTVETHVNELEIASSILGEPLELTKGLTIDVEYPAHAEIVLEGYFDTRERHDEGPFVDITGTYDIVRKEPVFTVTAVAMRRKPIFHMILSAGYEHRTLMGFPREAKIFKYVGSVSPVKDVHLSSAGCGWLEAIISIEKRHADEPIDAALAAFAAHPSMKRVIIVDPDINIRDYEEVHWAVLTRANPVDDMIIIPRSKGSSLDKSGEPRSKIIIDATIKGDKRDLFIRGRIPVNEKVRGIIDRLRKGLNNL